MSILFMCLPSFGVARRVMKKIKSIKPIVVSFFSGLLAVSISTSIAAEVYGAGAIIEPFVEARSFTYSENMPIDAFDNEFEGEWPDEGSYEFTHNKYRVGLKSHGFELSYFQREDYFFRTVGDTFDLIYMDENDIDFPLNQVFDVFLHVQKVDLTGGTLGYRFAPSPELELYFAGSYFESEDVLYGQIEGQVWQTESRPRADLVVDYIYTEEYLLDRPLTPPASGYGYGFDMSLAWQIMPTIELQIELEDVMGRIDWKHAPHTQMVMVSDRNRVDELGNPYKVPTLSGRHGFIDRTQVLPTHNTFRLAYSLHEHYVLTIERETYDKVNFNRLLAAVTPVTWFEAEIGYDLDAKTLSLGFWTPYASMLLATDDFDLKKSKNIRFEFALSYAF